MKILPGLVTVGGAGNITVLPDGSTIPIASANTTGHYLLAGQRVTIMFVEPNGVYTFGVIGGLIWSAWTPIIGGTGWVLDQNDVITAEYQRVGRETIHFFLRIIWGAGSSFGSGQQTLTLPAPPHLAHLGTTFDMRIRDDGSEHYRGRFITLTAGSVTMLGIVDQADTASVAHRSLVAGTPVSIATGDEQIVSGTYRAGDQPQQ